MRFTAVFLILSSICFSSCALRPLSGRGQANLDQWNDSLTYDPVTKRYYHTQPINEAQMDSHGSDLLAD